MRRVLCWLIAGVILSLGARCGLGWTGAHASASRLAATLAPEPFKDHADWCGFGAYPDVISDFGIAQGLHERWAVWMLTQEAVEAVRAGDVARACFLTSVACHYPQDAACMSHSPVLWKTTLPPNRLPEPVLAWVKRLPLQPMTKSIHRYGYPNQPLDAEKALFLPTVGPPTLMRPLYDATEGFLHDWMEDTAAALALPRDRRARIIGAETLADHEPWSPESTFPERFGGKPPSSPAPWVPRLGCDGWSFYHRWVTAHYQGHWLLPVAIFDEQSLNEGKPRFRDAAGLKAVFAEEFRIEMELTATLYRYVALAARTDVQADWGPLANEDSRLDAMARNGVVIALAQPRPDWQAAAEFLRTEITFARERQGVKAGTLLLVLTKPEELEAAAVGRRWGDCHLVLLDEAASGHRLRVRPRADGKRLEIHLTVGQPDAMGNMVDLLFDESRATLWGTRPQRQVVQSLQEVWAGARLMKELRDHPRAGNDLVAFVLPKGKPAPFCNTDDDRKRFAELTQGVQRTGMDKWELWAARGMGGAERAEASPGSRADGWLPLPYLRRMYVVAVRRSP